MEMPFGKSSTTNFIQFFTWVGRLKQIKRTGWVLRDVSDPECVAGHMYRMGVMSMCVRDPGVGVELDMTKVIKMTLVHDLAECKVGDITPHCGVSAGDKRKMESRAMDELTSLLPGDVAQEFKNLFDEYEANSSQEALLVKDLDRLDMILQAEEYETQEGRPRALEEFFESTRGKFRTPVVQKWVDDLYAKRYKRLAALSACGSPLESGNGGSSSSDQGNGKGVS